MRAFLIQTFATPPSTLPARAESSPGVAGLPSDASDTLDWAREPMPDLPWREPCWEPPWMDASCAKRRADWCRPAARSSGVHSAA